MDDEAISCEAEHNGPPPSAADALEKSPQRDANIPGEGALVRRHQDRWGENIERRLRSEGASASAAQSLGAGADAAHTLGQWAARYMLVKVCGRSKNTLAAKTNDLAGFMGWFVGHHGHGDIERWTEADTRYFLTFLQGSNKRPATIARALFTLKHFARYVHEQPGGVFARHGFPTGDIEAPVTEELECKKLSEQQVRALFAAARQLVEASAQKGRADLANSRARPQRNLALLGVFYYTGLRVSEVTALTRRQYGGTALCDVVRKGGRQARKLLLHPECARLIDSYLDNERHLDAPHQDAETGASEGGEALFLSARTGGAMDRARLGRMLARLAVQASALGVAEPFTVHPHQLRHTFGAYYREASGSDTETANALGHAGLQYVGRYVRKTDAERVGMLERALPLG